MACLYPPYGLTGKNGDPSLEIEASTVKELMAKAEKMLGPEFKTMAAHCTLFVNGRSISYLKGFKTPLSPEDVVRLVSPSAGG